MPPESAPAHPGQNPGVVPTLDAMRRVETATKYVESLSRTGPPRARGDRSADSPGRYAFLAAGTVVTGASGMTLGSCTGTLCSRVGAACTADGPSVTIYTASDGFTVPSGGRVVEVGWVDGDWSLNVARCT